MKWHPLFLMKPYYQRLARSDLWLPEAGVGGEGVLNECDQKAQTSSYKINKYWRCNVQRDEYS